MPPSGDAAVALPGRRRSAVAVPVPVLLITGAAVTAFAVAGELAGFADPFVGQPMTATLALTFTPLGVFVLRRLPGHPPGRLMVVIGALSAVAATAGAWSRYLPAAWLSRWVWLPAVALIPVLLLLVPDGRLPAPRWRALMATLVVAAGVMTVALAVAAAIAPRTLLAAGGTTDLPGPARVLALVTVAALAVELVATLGVLVALQRRWAAADATGRRQLECLVPAAVLLVVGVGVGAVTGLDYSWVPAVVAFPVGLTFAVLRFGLHDLDLYIHRGTVWAVLTGLVVAAYAGIATVLGAVVADPGSPAVSLLSAGAVAALLQPAQWVAQRAVRRLLYGRRDEPYAVITELGRHLEAVRDPLAVLPEIAGTVVDGLRVPYAAVRVADDDGTLTTAAERGRWAGTPESFPMTAHGRVVGELLVAARRPGTRFTGAETRLLRDLAGQAALAAEACRSAVALARARDRLVLAREEERRRLRRDLHDGVASALVGTRMLTEVVRRTLPDDGPAPGLLATLATDLDACTAEVRELIDGLRPAALDDGLAAALDALVARFRDQGTELELTVDGDLTELPAAAEVAAYRIVAEALTNVVKHAGAAHARVAVRRDVRELEVCVDDDGRGITGPARPDGVGLTSLRSRAEELGGRCVIGPGATTGTSVLAHLPLDG